MAHRISKLETMQQAIDKEWQEGAMYGQMWLMPHETGIPDAVLWIGFSDCCPDECIVMVSNIPNRLYVDDMFLITVPEYEVDRSRMASWVTQEILDAIVAWLKANTAIIQAIIDGKQYTENNDYFYKMVVKI